MMEPKIIFENDSFLILDKPSGWVVNRAKSVKGETLQDWIEKKGIMSTTSITGGDSFQKRSGIVHRLDKETSGVLVVAKTKRAFENLQNQFKKRQVKKLYTALVHGRVEPKKGKISLPVGRLPWNRERFGVLAGGREAITLYQVLNYYQKNREQFSLLELKPKTGRTHQIRIHLKYLGYPIVSDPFYAGRKTSRLDQKWCPRLFLHASQISFKDPKTGKPLSFKSELAADLQNCLRELKT